MVNHSKSVYSLLKNLPYCKTVENIYRVNRLSVRAKRLHTPGETTLGPGETTPGELDIGRNDRNSFIAVGALW